MNWAFWCWYLSSYTGLTTRDCKRNCPILLESSQADGSCTTRVISEWCGRARHLNGAMPWPMLWLLISHPKVLASLPLPTIFFVFPSHLAILGIHSTIFLQLCLLCFLIFLSISTQSSIFSPCVNLHTWDKQPLCELCTYPCTTKEKRGIE